MKRLSNKGKITSAITVIGYCLLVIGTVSCTDFDDYNKVTADATMSAGQTLWENIQQNPELTGFATLVKKAGFDDELNQTQCYTVWAPLNGTFDLAAFQNMDSKALMRQFVQNHIARYAHSASGTVSDRVLMLNEKSYTFEGTTDYKFDEVALKNANLPSSNGLIHTLNGVATFYPNLYEFITDSVLTTKLSVDSLRKFFQKYEETSLDTEASVPGSIVDGMQTYIDSVMVTKNYLWERNKLNAKINLEDSSYTFVMPTNVAWTKAYDRIKGSFNYLPSTPAASFGTSTVSPAIIPDVAQQQDSLVTTYLTSNLIFSNNDGYNQWLVGRTSVLGADTLRSTTGTKLSNPSVILDQTIETVKMSNGKAYVVDSLAFLPWETYAPERKFTASSKRLQARVTGNSGNEKIDVKNPDLTMISEETLADNGGTLSYLWLPTQGYNKAELTLYLPDVLSTTYDFYCVIVPPSVELGDTTEVLPNRVVFTLNYADADGKLKDYVFKDESEENAKWFDEYYEACKLPFLEENPKQTFSKPDAATLTAFSNDVTKVDTLYLGEFTFPVCYYGLSTTDMICPNIKISSPFSAFNKALFAGFAHDLRIAAIILKPKELVEYEESNK